VIWSAYLELVEEGHERIGWLVAAGCGPGRGDPGDGALLLGHVRVQIDLCGSELLVAEPEGDDGDVDARVQ
jgi:hypothetical protein